MLWGGKLMIKFSSWARVLITWVVLTSDLFLSYFYLRNPSIRLEILSLALNFVATTAIYYIYMNIGQDGKGEETEEGGGSRESSKEEEATASLYKLNFGSLIEDMGIWLTLFFLLYNIVPLSLFVHNMVIKNLPVF